MYLALLTIVPKNVIFELKEIQNKLLWSNKKSKIKHSTLSNDYKIGGLKNVDIELKIISLKSSLIRRFYNEVDHDITHLAKTLLFIRNYQFLIKL